MATRRPFVGRSAELAELESMLEDGVANHGGIALLRGPAGIGKTRLVEETVASWAARHPQSRIGRGYAVPEQGAPAFWPWTRACAAASLPRASEVLARDHGPAATTGTEAAAERFHRFMAVVDALAEDAETGPTVLVLEDLHWADAASLDLLGHLAGSIDGSAVSVIATTRDRAGPLLEETYGRLRRYPSVRDVPLEPLDVTEVARYLAEARGSSASAQLVHDRTGGLPLLLTAWDPAQPPATSADLRGIALNLVSTIAPEPRRLLESAAVLGERVDVALLQAVTNSSSETVAQAVTAGVRCGLLEQRDPSPLSFTHDLLRQGLRAAVDGRRAVEIHRDAARFLAADGAAPSSSAALVAAHWRLAGGDREALLGVAEWSQRAAVTATADLAHDDAARHLRHAEAALSAVSPDPVDLGHLRLRLATALYLAGRPREALEMCEQVSTELAGSGHPELVAASALVVRGLSFEEADLAVPRLAEIALAEPDQPDALRSRLLSQIASAQAAHNRMRTAEPTAGEAWRLAELSADPEALLDAARARELTLLGPGDDPERLRLARIAAAKADQLGRPVLAALAHGWRVRAAYALAQMDELDDAFDSLTSLTARTGLPLARWHLTRALAARAALEGRFEEAVVYNDEARVLAERSGDQTGAMLSSALLLHLALLRQDPAGLPSMKVFDSSMPLSVLMRGAGRPAVGERRRRRAGLPEAPPTAVAATRRPALGWGAAAPRRPGRAVRRPGRRRGAARRAATVAESARCARHPHRLLQPDHPQSPRPAVGGDRGIGGGGAAAA